MIDILFFLLLGIYGIIAWKDLTRGGYLLAALLPSYLWRITLFGLPTTFLEIAILLFLFIYLLRGRKQAPLPPLPRIVPLLSGTLLLLATISVITATDPVAAFGIWKAYYVEPLALLFVFLALFNTPEKRTQLLWWMLGSGAALALFGIIQWIFSLGIPAPWDLERRITSIFPYPNALGLFLGPLAAMGSVIALQHIGRKRLIAGGITGLMILSIFLAQSEAAIVALLGTLLLLGLLTKKTRVLAITILVLGAGLLGAISPLRHYAIEKITLRDYSGEVRRSQWKETISYLKDGNLLVGAGLSGYPEAFKPYHTRKEFEIFQYPHQIILNIWVELGVLGVIFFLVLFSLFLRALVLKKPHATLPILAALLHMLIHGLVDVPFFKNDLAAFTAILIALLLLSYDHQSSLQTSRRQRAG